MIVYSNDKSNNNLLKQCKSLQKKLKDSLLSQEERKKMLINCIEKIDTLNKSFNQNSNNTNVSKNLNDSLTISEKNITEINKLIKSLNNLKDSIYNNKSKVSTLFGQIDSFNNEYSRMQKKLEKNTYNMYKLLLFFVNDFDFPISDVEIKSISKKKDKNSILSDNRTLLISEKEGKVFLPYYIEDVQNILKQSPKTYKNIEDVIEKKYIIPLDNFKNPFSSRFREAFNLMKYKEKKSFFKCFDLAFELCWNSLLNPAIISACNNLDELDIYLDYLYSNELDKFNIFKIEYQINPI